jgi:hypothetical protein
MELADSRPDANWDAIRQLFLHANKLDTENPEPLVLYYESFGRSGHRPTANAVDGLEYAMLLAPQDQGLRMMAVIELINANKLREAKDALAPVAFDPHSSQAREMARKLLDALSTNDRHAVEEALSASGVKRLN